MGFGAKRVGFGDGSQPHLNIAKQVPEEHLDEVEPTSISIENYFGEVDYKTSSSGLQAIDKIKDDLLIKHTQDLILKQLQESNFNLKPLKAVTKELDDLQWKFDSRQKNLMSSGLREDEAVVLSKETQVQRVVRQCKESHGGPIHNVDELEKLTAEKTDEKSLASALNLEIRYRKFTCLLKVATNNDLFKQQGIDNKERITHLKQLLTDDTRPKCHASMSDIEALYETEAPAAGDFHLPEPANHDLSILNASEMQSNEQAQRSEWLSQGCWPLLSGEQVVVLTETGFHVASVEESHQDYAKVKIMKAINQKGFPPYSFWVSYANGLVLRTEKESVLTLRPILEPKGTSRKSLKFQLNNLDVILLLIESLTKSD